MKHIKKALSWSIAGSIGLTVIASLQGCGNQGPSQPNELGAISGDAVDQNYFMVIEQTGTNPDSYKLIEKHPTDGGTRAILRMPDGNERFLSSQELTKIADEEATKVEAGTSRLTQDGPGMQSGGMSFGELLLASAAGSLIGGMLANKLMGNRNFQRNQQKYGGGRPTSSISQPRNTKTASSKPRSGFFGGSRSSSSKSSGFGSFGG